MFRQIHIAALDRVLMYIVQLLPQHGFTFYDLRVISLFPKLIDGLGFMRAFEHFQQTQHLRFFSVRQMRQDFSRGIGLETLNIAGKMV